MSGLKRNLELDRLRAFAVIMTMMIHYLRVFFPWHIAKEYVHGTTITNLLKNSWAGVDLFFVISGFIISKMIVEKIDALKENNFSLVSYVQNFFIRRFFRIYPVAWVLVGFVFLCCLFFNRTGFFSTPENVIEAAISIFTSTFNYYFGLNFYHAFSLSPYWSLSVEEQFYFVFPFFLIFTKNNKQRAIFLISALLIITFVVRPLSTDNIFFTQNRCDGLLYGCLLYIISAQNWFKILIAKQSLNRVTRITLVSILVFILSTITSIGFSNAVVIPLSCIISSLLVGMAVLEKEFIIFIPGLQKILDYIGSRSYSLYIVHFPMFTFTQELGYRLSLIYHYKIDDHLAWIYTIVAFFLTISISECTYRFIERPFINKGRLLTQISVSQVETTNKNYAAERV